jgi:cell division FtsZ-interacting protein ZapD
MLVYIQLLLAQAELVLQQMLALLAVSEEAAVNSTLLHQLEVVEVVLGVVIMVPTVPVEALVEADM